MNLKERIQKLYDRLAGAEETYRLDDGSTLACGAYAGQDACFAVLDRTWPGHLPDKAVVARVRGVVEGGKAGNMMHLAAVLLQGPIPATTTMIH